MKNKFVSFLSLLACLLLLTASTSSFINDPENLFNTKTEELVTQKNVEYQKTKSKPEIRLLSLKDSNAINRIRPQKNQVIIAAALQSKKKNIQILVGKNYQDTLTQSKCSNIIRYAGNKLRSEKQATFNSGIQLVFNACETLIAQKDKLSYDKNSLTQEELQKIDHPQSVNLVWGLVIAALISFGLVLFKSMRKPH
ncbi:beta-propeller domain-containing protein [Lactobacillus taiwanensis]|uniref:TPM domain-containing protein n=1 Tax=Lactobacillus taiwanensis TaxID=508451 RepID=UPI000B992A72|nr:TPM domain-containing protein [Lactobacillus taiwanensis]OYS19918.1 beta-propeller domain-containing protein [Lactobacillus taiwanensis]OYS20313.1 beta-propeller domain-containing protein [Lactobacillus taiwanensis]